MWRLIINLWIPLKNKSKIVFLSLNRFFILSVLCSLIFTQDSGKYHTITGKITYVTAGSFYINTGRSEGISIGDLAKVYRENQKIGLGEISNISSKSAVCKIVEGTDFFKGDRVEILVIRKTTTESPPQPEPISGVISPELKSRVNGSITAKALYENNGNGQSYSQQRSFFSMNTHNIARLPVSVSAYGNLYMTSTGGEAVSPQINQMDIQYTQAIGNWKISAGRLINMSSTGSGATDGIRVSRESKAYHVSVITGIWDSPSGKKDFKNTVSVRWKEALFSLASLGMDIITQKNENHLDDFISVRSTILSARKWRGSVNGVFHFFDGSDIRFDPKLVNVGFSWYYSPEITTILLYNSTVGTGILGGYSNIQSQSLRNSSITSSIRYEFNPLLRTTFSSSLHQLEGNGDGHSFSLLLEQDCWSKHMVDLSVFSDYYASNFYRTYLFKTAISKRTDMWRTRCEVHVLNQKYRANNQKQHTYILLLDASRKMGKMAYLGSRIEFAATQGFLETYFAVDYSWRF
ncbi:MAG: hypothetical protein HQ510_11825 [Candidatus Marinimicrobia bacterium]|nr:hypothetical protein [Candidatus Neomarinimicrobiota bacterium]